MPPPSDQEVSVFELLQLLELWLPKTTNLAVHVASSGSGLEAAAIVVKLAQCVDKEILVSALQALTFQNEAYAKISRSFGATTDFKSFDRCELCHRQTGLRTVCLSCKKRRPHFTTKKQSISSLQNVYTLEFERRRAVAAGSLYLCECAQSNAIYKEFGGDLMFLLRNLLQTVVQYTHILKYIPFDDIVRALRTLRTQWLSDQRLSFEMEKINHVLNAVEALYVIQEFDGSPLPETPNKILETFQAKDITPPTKRPRRTTTASMKYRGPDGVLSIEARKHTIREMLLHFDVTDLTGWDPNSDVQVPMTSRYHCYYCGHENTHKRLRCTSCQKKLKSRVDYGALTDALVWSYLFQEVNIPLKFHNAHFSFSDIIELLPCLRDYCDVSTKSDSYKLQCYFVTHLIYVVSDWGRHSLRRDLFREEFFFILKSLPTAIKIEDPELVGEFIHCLRLFDVTKDKDQSAWQSIRNGMLYLLELERKHGSKGTFLSPNRPVYDKYHATFCGTMGLLVYDFTGKPLGDIKPEKPRPKCFHLRSS